MMRKLVHVVIKLMIQVFISEIWTKSELNEFEFSVIKKKVRFHSTTMKRQKTAEE